MLQRDFCGIKTFNIYVCVQDPYEYSRSANPTKTVFQKCVAALEGAKHGE